MIVKDIIDRLKQKGTLPIEEFLVLLSNFSQEDLEYICSISQKIAEENFGRNIYIRGLIEISNYCKNDCLYCGIRASNKNSSRYRLSKEQIISSCEIGYSLGFRTFVMQGGEDPRQTDDFIVELIQEIRKRYSDVAITLSLGEKPEVSYRRFFEAGANRYLLRHETSSISHYSRLHPEKMSLSNRLECLRNLKKIGFQTGTGIMVGSPYQTNEDILGDIRFIEELKPQMIGLGPFLPHKDTPFREFAAGNLEKTLLLLAIFRIMHPKALIPSTTALATLHPEGRLRGILAGCNVVMPNLSPTENRSKYSLYNDKAALGAESAEGLLLLQKQLDQIDYKISYERGDFEG